MDRLFTKVADGTNPNGRWFAGDINAIQDVVAALNDLTQSLGVGSLAIGDAGLLLVKYAATEARVTGALRVDGILRGLNGLMAGAYTSTARDAIASPPTGLVILNTTTSQYEWNQGSPSTPSWKPFGFDPAADLTLVGSASSLDFTGQSANNYFLTAKRSGDTVPRFAQREDGRHEWGPGGSTARDTFLERTSEGVLKLNGTPLLLEGQAPQFVMPPGVIVQFAGAVAPTGWLICDGSAISRTTYAALFTAIGTAYGPGDGSLTFNLPDGQQRFLIGKGAAGTGHSLGETGGAIDHTHTGPSHTHAGPSHTHSTPNHSHSGTTGGNSSSAVAGNSGAQGTVASDGHTHGYTTPSGGGGTTGSGGTNATGAGGTGATGASNPPYLAVNHIISH